MAMPQSLCASISIAGALTCTILSGCTTPSPFDPPTRPQSSRTDVQASIYRAQEQNGQSDDLADALEMPLDASAESYVRYALFQSPDVDRAYQRWRAMSERLPQVRSLPDPRLTVGFFLDEVETRVGPQQAKIGISQTWPWIGKLRDREDAAAKGALAAWYQYQEVQLRTIERVLIALHELAYLDSSIAITQENLTLLTSIEEIVRAKYRVGTGSHPQLIRVQLELAQLDDRLIQLRSLRPVYVSGINSILSRAPQAPIARGLVLPNRIAAGDAQSLTQLARESSPALAATEQRIEQARINTKLARKDQYPDITVGIEYIITDEASNPSIAESGDDPIMLSFGMSLPIWQEKYNAGVRESIANRLSISRAFDAQANTLWAQIYRAWFEHTDAARRVQLYQESLIPKAQESLSASLAAFRTGNAGFLDVLDTERTLLEFSIAAQRAIADQGKALATLTRLVGQRIPTTYQTDEAQP